jgi:hypothetical protein
VESSDDEFMSPEGTWYSSRCAINRLSLVLVAAAKHEAFLRARGRHYSNEAEAMKVRTCTFPLICFHAIMCLAR